MSRASVRSVRRYEFDAPTAAVWDGIGRVGEYRTWWPWLSRFSARGLLADDRWTMRVRTPALYRLSVTVHLTTVEPPRLIVAEVSGDVDGRAVLTLSPTGTGCRLTIESALTANRRLVRLLCALVPGLANRSHDALLDAGARQFAERALGVTMEVTAEPVPGADTAG